jgi:hypothetical protein
MIELPPRPEPINHAHYPESAPFFDTFQMHAYGQACAVRALEVALAAIDDLDGSSHCYTAIRQLIKLERKA